MRKSIYKLGQFQTGVYTGHGHSEVFVKIIIKLHYNDFK